MCDYGIQVEEEPFRERIINDHVGNILDEIVCTLQGRLISNKNNQNSPPAFRFYYETEQGLNIMKVWLSEKATNSSFEKTGYPKGWFDKRSLEVPIFTQMGCKILGHQTLGDLLAIMKGEEGELRTRFRFTTESYPPRDVHVERVNSTWSMIHDFDSEKE